MKKLKVALLAGSMLYFSDEGKSIYKKACIDLEEMSKILGFSLKIYPDFIMSEEKAMEMLKALNAEARKMQKNDKHDFAHL